MAGLGAVVPLGAWLFSPVSPSCSSAATQYAAIESRLWLFAVLGTVLAMLQLLVYSVLARQGTRSMYLVWAARRGRWSVGCLAGEHP